MEPAEPSLASLCADAQRTLAAVLTRLRRDGAERHTTLAAALESSATLVAALAEREAAQQAETHRKRTRRGGGGMTLLELPRYLLVRVAVRYVGAAALSRMDCACSFFGGVAAEVARLLRLRSPCWPQVLWRRREHVRALAGCWGDQVDAVADALRCATRWWAARSHHQTGNCSPRTTSDPLLTRPVAHPRPQRVIGPSDAGCVAQRPPVR